MPEVGVPVADRQRALVVGAGSIGNRHARLLAELGCGVRVVSRRVGSGDFGTIGEAVEAWAPHYVVIATEAGDRFAAVDALLDVDFAGKLLVEKPLGSVPERLSSARCTTWIGYNLRFHPVVDEVRTRLQTETVLTVQMRAGQYLPDWRPGRDHRDTASNREGGGVLRDLSHELDLVEWLFGPSRAGTAIIDRVSDLDLGVPDAAAVLLRCASAPVVSIELNYLDRVPQRTVVLATRQHVMAVDLIAGSISIDGKSVTLARAERDESYVRMHRSILFGTGERVCSLPEGRRLMRIIEALEVAAMHESWAAF